MSTIIVGGGTVDATLALTISQLSHGTLPIHLIEAGEPETGRHPGLDTQAIMLAAGTCQQLAGIDVWQAIADYITAIETIHISDRDHVGFAALDAQEYRIPALGQVVELHGVGLHLFALLCKASGVTLHCPDRVAHVSHTQKHVEVTLKNGEMVTGRLLMAADGTRSTPATACDAGWL